MPSWNIRDRWTRGIPRNVDIIILLCRYIRAYILFKYVIITLTIIIAGLHNVIVLQQVCRVLYVIMCT